MPVIQPDLSQGAPKRPIRVARAILDLGIQRAALFQSSRDPWTACKHQILRLFDAEKQAYTRRFQRMLEIAVSSDVDILVLPACSLAFRNTKTLAVYSELMSRIPLVFGSTLTVAGNGRHVSVARVFENGRGVSEFRPGEQILARRFRDVAVVSAVSSSVKRVCEGDIDSELAELADCRATVCLDAGHHQYGPRYSRHTIPRVHRFLDDAEKPATFVLSFWRYTGSKGDYPWIEPSSGRGWSWSRVTLDGDGDGYEDLVDVIDIA